MKTRLKILPAVCSIALFSACASNQTASVAPWSVTPVTTSSNAISSADALYKMGRYYQGQNRYDIALNAYQKALAADTGFVEARNGLGVIYSRQGKYREAIEAFQVAVKQAPKAAHIYNNMGYAYFLQGQYAESVIALEQATMLDPSNQRAFNNLGLAYAKAGNNGKSSQAFAQAASVSATIPSTSVAEIAAPAQSAVQLPENSVAVAAAIIIETSTSAEPQQLDAQVLTLPKDRGVIRPAQDGNTIAVLDSHVKLVKLASNISELHIQSRSEESVQVEAAINLPSPAIPEKLRVEVANGNGVTGAAGKVGRYLLSQGYPISRLTNQKPFQIRVTQIQYRDGYQAEALLLQASLPDAHTLVKRNDLRQGTSVRLVLGKDMVAQLAQYEYKAEKIQLALNFPGV